MEGLGEGQVLDLDARMPVGMAVDERCRGCRDADRRRAGRSGREQWRRRARSSSRGGVVQRREERRLARLVEDARTGAPRSSSARSPSRAGAASPATSTASALAVASRVAGGQMWPERVSASVSNGGMELLDVEAVLASEPSQRAAGSGGDLRADPVAGEARDDVCLRRAVISVGVGGKGVDTVVLLSLGTPGGRTSGVVSVGVCAGWAARERRSPLGGENQDELDADAARYRGARYEEGRGYVAEPHRDPECPRARSLSTRP